MSLLVTGSIALDTIETPYGCKKGVLGGSAVYFSHAASIFTSVRLVSVVGQDFPFEELESLKAHRVDLTGLKIEKGKTFRWHGRYVGDMSSARTVSVNLNTFGSFQPRLPAGYNDSKFIFLANASPHLQMKVLSQVKRPRFVIADTMNYWIQNEKKALLGLIEHLDGLIVNNDEIRDLTGMYHLVAAGREILKWGPRLLVIKKGEHGAILVTRKDFFAVPGYPVEVVRDPTGAGDAFAGGMMGYLAKTNDLSIRNLRKSLLYGNIIASFTIEDFGLERLKRVTAKELRERYYSLKQMLTI